MRFLADESCDFAIIRALRKEGYDVLAVSEITPRAKTLLIIKDIFFTTNSIEFFSFSWYRLFLESGGYFAKTCWIL